MQLISTWSGSPIPSTERDKWHYIANCWEPNARTFSLVQKFDGNDPCVAMRIPYTPAYNTAYFRVLSTNAAAKVVKVGTAANGQPLLLTVIGDETGDRAARRPCVLIYAGEHGDEHDAMWSAQGAVEYLVSGAPEATALRKGFTFIVVPQLDPEASERSEHSGIICTFLVSSATTESEAYAAWFQTWVNGGHRLDLVLDLHNVQSLESPHIACALMEGTGSRGRIGSAFHKLLMAEFARDGFEVSLKVAQRGWSPDRLGGWISRRYGAITLAYEVNSQASVRHLNLSELKVTGKAFVSAMRAFFSTPDGAALLDDVDTRRSLRALRLRTHQAVPITMSAIESEAELSKVPSADKKAGDLLVESWVR